MLAALAAPSTVPPQGAPLNEADHCGDPPLLLAAGNGVCVHVSLASCSKSRERVDDRVKLEGLDLLLLTRAMRPPSPPLLTRPPHLLQAAAE